MQEGRKEEILKEKSRHGCSKEASVAVWRLIAFFLCLCAIWQTAQGRSRTEAAIFALFHGGVSDPGMSTFLIFTYICYLSAMKTQKPPAITTAAAFHDLGDSANLVIRTADNIDFFVLGALLSLRPPSSFFRHTSKHMQETGGFPILEVTEALVRPSEISFYSAIPTFRPRLKASRNSRQWEWRWKSTVWILRWRGLSKLCSRHP